MHIVKRSHKLREVEPCYVLGESARHGNKVKQLAALDKFENYEFNILILLGLLLIFNFSLAHLDHVDDVWVL
jgi:hypothetical protein